MQWSSWVLEQGIITAAELRPAPRGDDGTHFLAALRAFLALLPPVSGTGGPPLALSCCDQDCRRLAQRTVEFLDQVFYLCNRSALPVVTGLL